jgi:hypothetical protein
VPIARLASWGEASRAWAHELCARGTYPPAGPTVPSVAAIPQPPAWSSSHLLLPDPATQPGDSAYPSGRGWHARGGSARRPLGARALGASEARNREAGRGDEARPLTARTLHFPLCFLFTCNRKNNRSSRAPPAPAPTSARPRRQGPRHRCRWKLHLAVFKQALFYTKANHQIKVLGALTSPYSLAKESQLRESRRAGEGEGDRSSRHPRSAPSERASERQCQATGVRGRWREARETTSESLKSMEGGLHCPHDY